MSRPIKLYLRASWRLALILMTASAGMAHYEVAPTHDTHIVQPGETLDAIARMHGVAAEQIRSANGIPANGIIYSGTQLRMRGSGFVAGDGSPVHHTLAQTDTLEHIAAHRGLTLHAVSHLNDVDPATELPAGSTIHLPSPWVCPVADARFFNDWGFPRAGGRFHSGTDLFAPKGTPVRAPVDGVVSQVTGEAGGHQFVLDGDDGNTYLGSHMDRFGASGRVSAGTVIGYVGHSGNARGSEPHLHFQIHPRAGQAENPYPSLLANGC